MKLSSSPWIVIISMPHCPKRLKSKVSDPASYHSIPQICKDYILSVKNWFNPALTENRLTYTLRLGIIPPDPQSHIDRR